MYNTQLKTILYKYANDHGLGMPLTAEQCLNAMSQWLTVTLPDCIDIKTVVVNSLDDVNVTLEGNGTPDSHYIFTFYLCKGEKGDTGDLAYISAYLEDGDLYIANTDPGVYDFSINKSGDLTLSIK